MPMMKGLGRGLGSLIPQKPLHSASTITDSPARAAGGPRFVPVSDIQPNPHQPREQFGHHELDDLISSVKTHGILQPLLVTLREEGGYELIAGERRLRAAKLAGLPSVPVIIRSAKEMEKLELALIENIQRQDLNPLEEAKAYRKLIFDHNLTQEEVARRVGKSRPVVANALRLLTLPETVQLAIRDGKVAASAARTIASFETPDEQLKFYETLAAEKLTVRDLEERLRERKPASRGPRATKDVNLEAAEEELERALGTKVRIVKRGEKGKIEIQFYSNEELGALREKLTA